MFASPVRSYSTSEANPNDAPQATEIEKKLQADNEALSVQITSLNEKNDELLVGGGGLLNILSIPIP